MVNRCLHQNAFETICQTILKVSKHQLQCHHNIIIPAIIFTDDLHCIYQPFLPITNYYKHQLHLPNKVLMEHIQNQ